MWSWWSHQLCSLPILVLSPQPGLPLGLSLNITSSGKHSILPCFMDGKCIEDGENQYMYPRAFSRNLLSSCLPCSPASNSSDRRKSCWLEEKKLRRTWSDNHTFTHSLHQAVDVFPECELSHYKFSYVGPVCGVIIHTFPVILLRSNFVN